MTTDELMDIYLLDDEKGAWSCERAVRAVAAAALMEAAEKAHDIVMLYLSNGRPQDILLGLRNDIEQMAAEQEGGTSDG